MEHPADRLEQIFRIARVNSPVQAHRKATHHLRAFLVQHQALVVAASQEIHRSIKCGCDDCIKAMPDMLQGLSDIQADLRSLFIAADLLENVSPGFEKPHREHFEVAEDALREVIIDELAGDETSDTRDTLEHILSLPDPDAPS